MTCQVEQIADCGDISTLSRALFFSDKEDPNWLTQCHVSLSSCGGLLAVGYRSRLCLLTAQWISSSDSNTYLISWSGTLPSEVTAVLALPICPSHPSSQNGADWFCIIVGFKNGGLGFYTNTGHMLFLEKFDEKPILKVSCHTGTYGTLPDDIYVLYPNCECIITGQSLFQTLRYAKAQLARVQAGAQTEYNVDARNIQARKWSFNDQETVSDAAVAGLELKNTYDHLLAASTYGGYDTWYRSIPPANTLILTAGSRPYVGFHYALEGGTAPPLQDVARAVANRIKSALPGWLGGGAGREGSPAPTEPRIKAEPLALRGSLIDDQRQGVAATLSPDRRLAAVTDGVGRVAVVDLARGRVRRMIKGARDAQCAFMQVFEHDSKKPQLSTIKDTRRALFLIIYKPRKGLIDIRLMHSGHRVAVFTATKNGKLLYNTCGLVGAEPNYTHKKLNLPEIECVLLDPDGKLKKFNIPFFYALEGEHSDRSKDLHILRDLREYMKRTPKECYDKEEILKKAAEVNTPDLKKHCIEMLVRNYNVAPDVVMACLLLFWKGEKSSENDKIMIYFKNLMFVTLFYRRLNNEDVEDMRELVEKIDPTEVSETKPEETEKVDKELEFKLLVDDDAILERLLILAQEKDYRQQISRVTFADNLGNSYKDFVTSFKLEEPTDSLAIKPDVTTEKLNALASYTFKSLLKIEDLTKLSDYIKDSKIETKEVVRLLLLHIMNMSLEDINLELIQQTIAVLYHACRAGEGARIAYNEVSEWWHDVRAQLAAARCPLRALLAAMACKAVAKIYEEETLFDEDAWESVTKENAMWGLLIGKLEDISILTIVLMLKETFYGDSLPKLVGFDFDINLKVIYSKGTGSVTELISKWLCSMGVPPEAVVAHELLDRKADEEEGTEDEEAAALFLGDHRCLVDDNVSIFKWVSMLRQQFPFSTNPDYILVNMSWEYAAAWQKSVQDIDKLSAAQRCLSHISDLQLRVGLTTLVWTTYIKQVFEPTCRLVNKVGKLPKEGLCQQGVGLTDVKILEFLDAATNYLKLFYEWATSSEIGEKRQVQFEKIWEDSAASLIEVAQGSGVVSRDLLSLTRQMASTVEIQCRLGLRVQRPLSSLYDVDYHFVFDSLTGLGRQGGINMRPSEKLRNPRMKFINKAVRAAAELVAVGAGERERNYDAASCLQWLNRIEELAELWEVDMDFVKRQEAVWFFHLGYDGLAEEAAAAAGAGGLLPALTALAAQRFKRHLERCADPAEWIAAAPPSLAAQLTSLESDHSVAAAPLPSTVAVLSSVLRRLPEDNRKTVRVPSGHGLPGHGPPAEMARHVSLAEMMLQACETLDQLPMTT